MMNNNFGYNQAYELHEANKTIYKKESLIRVMNQNYNLMAQQLAETKKELAIKTAIADKYELYLQKANATTLRWREKKDKEAYKRYHDLNKDKIKEQQLALQRNSP